MVPLFLASITGIVLPKLRGEVVAFTETPLPVRFDPETLETLGVYAYQGGLRGQLSIAHPHFDFQWRCHYSYLLEFGRQSRYLLYSLTADTGKQALVGTARPRNRPTCIRST